MLYGIFLTDSLNIFVFCLICRFRYFPANHFTSGIHLSIVVQFFLHLTFLESVRPFFRIAQQIQDIIRLERLGFRKYLFPTGIHKRVQKTDHFGSETVHINLNIGQQFREILMCRQFAK